MNSNIYDDDSDDDVDDDDSDVDVDDDSDDDVDVDGDLDSPHQMLQSLPCSLFSVVPCSLPIASVFLFVLRDRGPDFA